MVLQPLTGRAQRRPHNRAHHLALKQLRHRRAEWRLPGCLICLPLLLGRQVLGGNSGGHVLPRWLCLLPPDEPMRPSTSLLQRRRMLP